MYDQTLEFLVALGKELRTETPQRQLAIFVDSPTEGKVLTEEARYYKEHGSWGKNQRGFMWWYPSKDGMPTTELEFDTIAEHTPTKAIVGVSRGGAPLVKLLLDHVRQSTLTERDILGQELYLVRRPPVFDPNKVNHDEAQCRLLHELATHDRHAYGQIFGVLERLTQEDPNRPVLAIHVSRSLPSTLLRIYHATAHKHGADVLCLLCPRRNV